MRITIDIDSALLDTVVELTGEKTKSKAVNKALDEYLRRVRIGELRAMAGRIPLDDTREEQGVVDRRRQASLDRLRRRDD